MRAVDWAVLLMVVTISAAGGYAYKYASIRSDFAYRAIRMVQKVCDEADYVPPTCTVMDEAIQKHFNESKDAK